MSLFNVNQTVASKARNTSTVPIKDKQFLIVTDSGDIFYDSDGTRVQLTDIIVLDTESQRLALTSPFEKFYFVKGSGALWRYNNSSWVKYSGGGSTSVDKVLSVASWSDNKQNVEISGLTADQKRHRGLVSECVHGGKRGGRNRQPLCLWAAGRFLYCRHWWRQTYV